MKAILLDEYGPPDVLRHRIVPDPQPRMGEIRIQVHAATVNRVLDVALRAGKESWRKPILPLIPGVDCAGVVDAIGTDVRNWRVGQRVAAANLMPLDPAPETGVGYSGRMGLLGIDRPGAFAELVVVPACAATLIPDGMSFHEAAIGIRHLPTAWNLLFNLAKLQSNETVVVMGAAGNLGLLGVQLAKHVARAKVIAVAGSQERVAKAIDAGADHGINHSDASDLATQLLELTGGRGIDVIYDNTANPDVLPSIFSTLGRGGRLVTAGAHAGPKVEIDFAHVVRNRVSMLGSTGSERGDVEKCFAAVTQGLVRLEYGHLLPLSMAAEGHRLVEANEAKGKIVLDPTLD